MYITNYQMHNVLKVYTSQLSKNRSSAQPGKATAKPRADSINISTEGRRQSVINKVAEDIVARITLNDGQPEPEDQSFIDHLRENLDRPVELEDRDSKPFVYNVLGANQEKMMNSLSTEDSRLLMQRLEKLAEGEKIQKV